MATPKKMLKILRGGGQDADKLGSRLQRGNVGYDREAPGADDLPTDDETDLSNVDWNAVARRKKAAAAKKRRPRPTMDPRRRP